MKKWISVLLMLVLILSLTGCQKDPAKEAAKVVAEVNGETITKGEALAFFEQAMLQTQYMSEMYGMAFDPEDKATISSVKAQTLTMMTETLALEQKLAEVGLALSEEDEAAVHEKALSEYDLMVQEIVAGYGLAEEAAKEELNSQGFAPDMVEYYIRLEEVENRLREYAAADLTVTDEEIRTEYEARVQNAKESYQDDPDLYAADAMTGTVYYRPAGYRSIRNLVISLPEEILSQQSALSEEMYYASYYAYMYQAQIDSYGPSMDADTLLSYNELVNTYNLQMETLQTQIMSLSETGRQQILAEAESVLALCQAEGADFDAIMAEHNDDVGSAVLIGQGYPVNEGNTNYVPEFVEGAMALENIGDMSGLIASDYGYHILLYAGDVEEGEVELDEAMSADIGEELMDGKREDAYAAARAEWIEEAKIKTHVSRL